MKGGDTRSSQLRTLRSFFPMLICCGAVHLMAGPFRLVSVRDPSQAAPAGGSGDSFSPVISADGRFVLFASSANNLVMDANSNPLPASISGQLNVFMRDRSNATTILISANVNGTGGGNGDSMPTAISTDGRYALFESTASDLVANDTNGVADVFLRDVVAGMNVLVSVSTNGGVGNGVCRGSVMTPDGRYVAFVSAAANLVPADTNQIPDVFVRDMIGGVTTLVSVGARLINSYDLLSGSESPDISADGRYVAFYSIATNLVPGVPSLGNIYVRDVVAGTTIWASTNGPAIAKAVIGTSNVICYNHVLSADGRHVAFEVSTNGFSSKPGLILRFNLDTGLTDRVHTNAYVQATQDFQDVHNLDMTPDGRFVAFVANTNIGSGIQRTTCIYRWDAQTGLSSLASGDLSNAISFNTYCDWPTMDSSGRFVAFLNNATNMVTNSMVGDYHLYVRDVQAGTTSLVAAETNGPGSSLSLGTAPRLSADGRFVAFECFDANLVANDRNHDSDVFVRDLTTNVCELISARHPALPSASGNGPSAGLILAVNRDGRFVAFCSDADNLVPNDTNGVRDVFLRDLLSGTTVLVSISTNGAAADNISTDPAVSDNGRYVAFSSSADDLVTGDNNNAQDVFVRDMQAGATILVSVGMSGGSANGPSYSTSLSSDGRYVLFSSVASNLVAGAVSANENLYLRDTLNSTTLLVSASGVLGATMTRDARFVAFGGLSGNVYLWDLQSASTILTNAATRVSALAVSPDGSRLVYNTTNGFYAVDRVANTNWQIGPALLGTRLGLRFSVDGRQLTYAGLSNFTNNIYVYDFQSGTNLQVSRSFSFGPPNGASDSPDISADGRFVAFRSAATNILAAADSNGVPDLFLYDRFSGTTSILSGSRLGASPADNRTRAPVFSGDGRTLLFQGVAADLVAQDFNHGSDVFALSLLYASIIPSGTPGLGPTLSWPARPGEGYRVQFKDKLSDPAWQDVRGTVTFIGNTAQLTDFSPASGGRFYRIEASNP